jgi:dihydroneopterin aldolase
VTTNIKITKVTYREANPIFINSSIQNKKISTFASPMGKIQIEGIKIYAYHGCKDEEASVGGNYQVDVSIEADLSKPAQSDKLSDTIDYVKVYEIVRNEMSKRSKLIEHVAKRIIDALKKNLQGIKYAEVKVTKLNPPINGVVENVSVILSE